MADGKAKRSITGLVHPSSQQACHVAIAWVHRHLALVAQWLGFNREAASGGIIRSDLTISIKFANLWATQKSGLSFGAAVGAALVVSWFRPEGCEVEEGVAVTGEVNMRGNVLPVADIPFKLKAAWKAGCRKVSREGGRNNKGG